jgi:predicted dinucleotide-binding enzyme
MSAEVVVLATPFQANVEVLNSEDNNYRSRARLDVGVGNAPADRNEQRTVLEQRIRVLAARFVQPKGRSRKAASR